MHRRRFLSLGMTASATAISGCLGGRECEEGRTLHKFDVGVSESAGWPMPFFDAANRGWNPAATGPTNPDDPAWRYSTCGASEWYHIYHNGSILQYDRVHDARTGELLETHEVTGPVVGADGALYGNVDDGVCARVPTSEENRWRASERGRSIRVADGVVAYEHEAEVIARDASSGAELWRTEFGDRSFPSIGIWDEVVVVVTDDDLVAVYGAETGEERWRRALPVDFNDCPPAIADGSVYLGSWDGEVLALNTMDGATEWRRDVGFRVRGPVAVTDELVYAAGRGATVVALGRGDGHVVWEVTKDVYGFAPPSVAGGRVYVGASALAPRYGMLYALDAATGADLWTFETRQVDMGDYAVAGLNTSPVVADGALFVATGAGDIYAFSDETQ